MLANKFHIKRRHFYTIPALYRPSRENGKNFLFKNESSPTPASSSCILSQNPSPVRFYIKNFSPGKNYRVALPKKWLKYYNFQRDDFSKIYLLPFKATKETKLIMFQYKIIHHILFTNSLLYKLKKKFRLRTVRSAQQYTKLLHTCFVECVQASIFWSELACRAGVFLVDTIQDTNILCRHLG